MPPPVKNFLTLSRSVSYKGLKDSKLPHVRERINSSAPEWCKQHEVLSFLAALQEQLRTGACMETDSLHNKRDQENYQTTNVYSTVVRDYWQSQQNLDMNWSMDRWTIGDLFSQKLELA